MFFLKNLDIENINIQNLKSDTISGTELNIINGSVTNLITDTISGTELNIINGSVTNLITDTITGVELIKFLRIAKCCLLNFGKERNLRQCLLFRTFL